MELEYNNCTLEALLSSSDNIYEQQQLYSQCVNWPLINTFNSSISSDSLDYFVSTIIKTNQMCWFPKLVISEDIYVGCKEPVYGGRDVKIYDYFKRLQSKVALPHVTFLHSIGDNSLIVNPKTGLSEFVVPKIPIFAWSDINIQHRTLLLLPDLYMIEKDRWDRLRKKTIEYSNNITWSNKLDIAYWVGSPTGLGGNDINIHDMRIEAILQSHYNPDLIYARFVISKQYKSYVINGSYISKTDDGEKLREILIQKFVSYEKQEQALKYKYLLSIDGVTTPWERPAWILSSNSLLIKQQSNFIGWSDMLLVPFKHFVPVKDDLSDLKEKILWCRSHDLEVQRIIKNANKLADFIFSREAIDNFTYHSINLYAKKFNNLRNDLNKSYIALPNYENKNKPLVTKPIHTKYNKDLVHEIIGIVISWIVPAGVGFIVLKYLKRVVAHSGIKK